ncbi:hypothetical protein WN943_003625 [Citrus x changshan-huyou]
MALSLTHLVLEVAKIPARSGPGPYPGVAGRTGSGPDPAYTVRVKPGPDVWKKRIRALIFNARLLLGSSPVTAPRTRNPDPWRLPPSLHQQPPPTGTDEVLTVPLALYEPLTSLGQFFSFRAKHSCHRALHRLVIFSAATTARQRQPS